LNGFDSGTISRPTYLNSNQLSVVFPILDLYHKDVRSIGVVVAAAFRGGRFFVVAGRNLSRPCWEAGSLTLHVIRTFCIPDGFYRPSEVDRRFRPCRKESLIVSCFVFLCSEGAVPFGVKGAGFGFLFPSLRVPQITSFNLGLLFGFRPLFDTAFLYVLCASSPPSLR